MVAPGVPPPPDPAAAPVSLVPPPDPAAAPVPPAIPPFDWKGVSLDDLKTRKFSNAEFADLTTGVINSLLPKAAEAIHKNGSYRDYRAPTGLIKANLNRALDKKAAEDGVGAAAAAKDAAAAAAAAAKDAAAAAAKDAAAAAAAAAKDAAAAAAKDAAAAAAAAAKDAAAAAAKDAAAGKERQDLRDVAETVRLDINRITRVISKAVDETKRVLVLTRKESDKAKEYKPEELGLPPNDKVDSPATTGEAAHNILIEFKGVEDAANELATVFGQVEKLVEDFNKVRASIEDSSTDPKEVRKEILEVAGHEENSSPKGISLSPISPLLAFEQKVVELQHDADLFYCSALMHATNLRFLDAVELKNGIDDSAPYITNFGNVISRVFNDIEKLPGVSSLDEFTAAKKVKAEADTIVSNSAIIVRKLPEVIQRLERLKNETDKSFEEYLNSTEQGADMRPMAWSDILIDKTAAYESLPKQAETEFVKIKDLNNKDSYYVQMVSAYWDMADRTVTISKLYAEAMSAISKKRDNEVSQSIITLSQSYKDDMVKLKSAQKIMEDYVRNISKEVTTVRRRGETMSNELKSHVVKATAASNDIQSRLTNISKAVEEFKEKDSDLQSLLNEVLPLLSVVAGEVKAGKSSSLLTPDRKLLAALVKMNQDISRENVIFDMLLLELPKVKALAKEIADNSTAVQAIVSTISPSSTPLPRVNLDEILQSMAGSRADIATNPALRLSLEKELTPILDVLSKPTVANMMSLPLSSLATVSAIVKSKVPSADLDSIKDLIDLVISGNSRADAIVSAFTTYGTLPSPADALWKQVVTSLKATLTSKKADIEKVLSGAQRVVEVPESPGHRRTSAIITRPMQVPVLASPAPPGTDKVIYKALVDNRATISRLDLEILNLMVAGFLKDHPGFLAPEEADYAVKVAMSTREWLGFCVEYRTVGNILYQRLHPEGHTLRHPIEATMTRYREAATTRRIEVATARSPVIEKYASYSLSDSPVALPSNFATVIKGVVSGSPDTQDLLTAFSDYNSRKNPETYTTLLSTYRRVMGTTA